jgi:tetratricopeptide (TPR) repeat protein
VAKIYISSTFSDLKEYRKAVYEALRAMRHDVIAMEDYVAADQRPLDRCLADVEASDLYLGIFAWRYGYVPDKDNPDKRSITELEFRRALSKGKPCLIFLLDENTPWPPPMIEHGEGGESLKRLREELGQDYLASFFKSPEELAGRASTAVSNWEKGNLSKPDHKLVTSDPSQVNISRLPVTGKDLFGRERELRQLDEAWDGKKTNVLTLVAWGGVGKSALVNHWLAQMAENNYRGASRVYAWSFYSQGTTEKTVSADQFIEAALTWFGDPDPNKGSPWDKGERLARLVGGQRSLLILDGLEPLQHPPGPDEGRLKDQALQSLLKSLAAHNEGLCLISTREAVTDLSSFEGRTVTRIDLEYLSPEAGAKVLRAQGVKGSEDELKKASEEFDGHSLALTLLGSYLSDVYDGDVRRRVEVKGLEEDIKYGRHAQRVMTSYEKWFGEGPELAVLRMLGLFNRPADKGAIDELRANPVIKGLTETIRPLTEHKWKQVLAKLRRAKLLSQPSVNNPDTLDAHPLIREHFGQQLKRENPNTWKAANFRLYEHFKRIAKVFPNTLEEMTPLYAAVSHGCEAGKHQEAAEEVYYKRICREEEFFSINKLGAFGSDLAALTGFFDPPWLHPVSSLTDAYKSFVLSVAGFCLRALGRLTEAVQPSLASLQADLSLEDWENAAIAAGNLSELYLVIGDLPQSLAYAEQSVELADKSGDSFQRLSKRTTLAHALRQAGRLSEAEAAFHEAELMQRELWSQVPFLFSLRGYQYCDLLLEQGKHEEVKSRADKAIQIARENNWLLAIALDHLSLGRAYLLQAQLEKTNDYRQATEYLNQAVDGLRLAGSLDHLPRGLIARAELFSLTRDFSHARTDLDEAMSITERGKMQLHEADCHLGYARLYLAEGEKEKARVSWEKAKEMIERMGYHRRDKDVVEIERQISEMPDE